MEPLSQKVSTLLRKRFGRGARVNLKDEDGIIGTVTSTKFRDVDTIDRVNMIWKFWSHRSASRNSGISLLSFL